VLAADFFGLRAVVQVGDVRIQTPAGLGEMPCAPFAQGEDVAVAVRPLCEALGMRVTEANGAMDVSIKPAQIVAVRYDETDERFRTVIELDGPTPFFAVAAPSVISVGLVTHGGFVPPERAETKRDSRGNLVEQVPPPRLDIPLDGVLSREISIENLENGFVRIGAHGRYGVIGQRFFTLTQPTRIVLEFPKIWDTSHSESVGQDIEATWFNFGTAGGPVTAYAALARVSQGRLKADVALGGSYSTQKSPLSAIAQRAGAIIAVNGGFFAPDTGDPIGTLILDGEWVRFPYAQRTALLMGGDGKLSMGNVGAQAQLTIGGRTVGVSGLNEWMPSSGDCIKVISRKWRDSWPCIPGQGCLQVRNGVVTQVFFPKQRVEVATPPDGYLVAGSGEGTVKYLQSVATGTSVQFAAWLVPHVPGVVDALGGGPRIVRDGAYYNTAQGEAIPSDIANSRAPRTALGLTATGDLLLVVVDGRQAGYSVGMTLGELAQLMIRLGARDAMCLDGGGSSEMAYQGQPANRPSDGHERPIPNALVIVPRN
jgi:exopolysaccharide biosynthesis protein